MVAQTQLSSAGPSFPTNSSVYALFSAILLRPLGTSGSFRYPVRGGWKGTRSTLIGELRPSRQVWYVWPGLGTRAEGRYGKPLGQSVFVVTAAKASLR